MENKNDSDCVSETELVALIHAVVQKQGASGFGDVDLGHWDFDRVPCSPRKLYAIAKKHCKAWGYEYRDAKYTASGNRAFARVMADQKAKYTKPWLYKIR